LIRRFGMLVLVASLAVPQLIAAELDSDARPCHWWQFRRCDQRLAEGLPDDAPRSGVVITVDVSRNHAYLFRDGELLTDGPAATGTEKILEHGDDLWLFHTPRGHLKVLRKIVDPIWVKPDWAFIEAGERIPPPNSPKRQVKGHLGKYALALGEGILIHGTDDPHSIGRYASHGCIRLPNDLLRKIWNVTKVGTDVYIFDSDPPQPKTSGAPEHHSDLDYRSH
jgi:L,D-transpeptidase-like protein